MRSPAEPGLAVGVLLVLHGAFAVGAWKLLPHGFALSERRLWTNQVLPWVALCAAIAGVVGLLTKRGSWGRTAALGFYGAWIGGFAAACFVFPQSARRFGVFVGPLALIFFVSVVRELRRSASRRVPLVSVGVGVVLGAFVALAQRGSDPATRPANVPLPRVATESGASLRPIDVGGQVRVFPTNGRCVVEQGGLRIEVDPLLSFESRSPDRCWTIFAGRRRRTGPSRGLTGRSQQGDRVELAYADDGRSWLRVAKTSGAVSLEARSEISAPVFSHLNSFCQVRLQAQEGSSLALSFSPAPTTPVKIVRADYPVGRPARLGYLDASGVFRVVEARSGEKGPFRELANGRLDRSESLALTVHVDGAPAGRLVFEDFASQASTQTSPTAGWGLPENAVEFRLVSTSPPVAYIWLELAATSVGRGWDSVGHTAGVYRNRVRVEAP